MEYGMEYGKSVLESLTFYNVEKKFILNYLYLQGLYLNLIPFNRDATCLIIVLAK